MSLELNHTDIDRPFRSYPAPGTSLARILYDQPFRARFNATLKKSNPFVVFFYQMGLLPLFGASRSLMILTTRGCKSGKKRRTPIGYFYIGGVAHIISAWGRSSGWYNNLRANPDEVQIQIGLRRSKVHAQVLDDPAEKWKTIDQLMTESPKVAQYLFGWDPQTDRRDPADFSEVISKVLIVRCTTFKG